MPDVFLYAGQVSPADVKLTDPTVLAGGAPAITGTSALTQSAHTIATAGLIKFVGTSSVTQAADSIASTGKEIFKGPASTNQTASTITAAAAQIFKGPAALVQSAATASDVGIERFTGTLSATRAAATATASGTEVFSGPVSIAQSASTIASNGKEEFAGTIAAVQNAATVSGIGREIFSGSIALTQSAHNPMATGLEIFAGEVDPAMEHTMLATGTVTNPAITEFESPTASAGVRLRRRPRYAPFAGQIAGVQSGHGISATGIVTKPKPKKARKRFVRIGQRAQRGLRRTEAVTGIVMLPQSGFRITCNGCIDETKLEELEALTCMLLLDDL